MANSPHSGRKDGTNGLARLFQSPLRGRQRPVHVKYLKPSSQNGPVKIIKPANKEQS